MIKDVVLIPQESLNSLIEELQTLRESLKSVGTVPIKQVYTNKMLKELLGVGDKLIKQYRDRGLLSFTQVGDKYWYSQEDVDEFLSNCHNKAWINE